MQDLIEFIKSRRTIRKYKPEQIKEEELQKIIEAGLYAPNAGSQQKAKFLVIQDKEVLQKLGVINRLAFGRANSDKVHYVSKNQPSIADTDNIKSGFYDAPTVILIFTPKDWYYPAEDCSAAAESMMLEAWSLGIGSCFVSRADETFATEYGKEILKKAGLEENIEAKVLLTLGYPEGEIGSGKPRKENRVIRL